MIATPLQKTPCLFLAEENYAKTGSACLAVVEAKDLVKLAEDFLSARYHLEDICGLDTSDGAVSVYHFDHFDEPCRVTVIVIAPHEAASFPSIASVYHGAEWHERETRDFYGFIYEGNPNLIPLLMAEDMDTVHPLKKEENARVSLAALFSTEGRERTIVKKADGFTLLDVPVKEAPAPAPEEKPETKAAPKPEAKAPKKEAPASPEAEEKPASPAAVEKKITVKAKVVEEKKASSTKADTAPKPKAEAKKPTAPAKENVKTASGKKGEGDA